MKKKERRRLKKMQGNKQQTIQIDPSKLDDVVCAECGHNLFEFANRLKFLSRLISPSGKPMYYAEQLHVCKGCGAMLMQPAEWERANKQPNIIDVEGGA